MAKLVRQLNNDHVLIDASTAPLLARMRSSLSSALGRPIEDGDPEMVAAASLLPYFGQGLAAADIASKSMLLQFATDEDLEAIGAHYGIARRTLHAKMAVSLTVYGIFEAGKSYAVSITGEAPDGTLFSYINDAWTTPVDAQHPEFTLTCEATGDAYNGLDELINPVLSVTPSGETAVTVGVLTVLSASRGGGPETDDVYASRIHDTLLARTAAGSKAGYEALARTVDGVYDASAALDYEGRVLIAAVAPSRLEGDVEAEINSSPLLPLGLGVIVALLSEAPRGEMVICWSTPTGGDVDGINARVDAALDAVLAPFYYTFTPFIDTNIILGAVTDAGGVGAYIDAEEVYGGSFARIIGYMTEHTIARAYQGESEWI